MKKSDLIVAGLVTLVLLGCFAYTMLFPCGCDASWLIGA